MLEKKTETPHDDSTSSGEASPRLNDHLEEYRMSAKKVELPMFDRSDPVGWITLAEAYFEVQDMSVELKIKFARLSMEGHVIHWFNLLWVTEDDLMWEKLKRAQIECYGGWRFDNPFVELSLISSKHGRWMGILRSLSSYRSWSSIYRRNNIWGILWAGYAPTSGEGSG